MKKTATLLALAGLSMAAKSENHHSSLRHPKVVDHTPESDPYVIPNPTNQPKEAINKDDELLLIYKPRFDIDPGMIIRPPRDDIDRGILAKPRPANQFLYVDDELSLFNVHALEHHGRSRGGWHLASAQEPLDSKWNLAYKEGDKNAIDKPKDIGGMIVKEKGVFVTDKHADDELLFDIKPLDFGEIRRGGKSADDELIMFADGGMDPQPRRNKNFDPKTLTKPWYNQNQVMYADDELTLFETQPLHYRQPRRGAHRPTKNADDELIMFADGGLELPPTKTKILDPRALTKPWYNQNQVMYADDDLSLLPIKPINYGPRRGLAYPRNNNGVKNELLLVSAQSVDQTRSRGSPREIRRKLRVDEHADSELCQKTDSMKPKEVGGMIIKEKGVYIQYGRHDDADSELSWFNTQPLDHNRVRRGGGPSDNAADDELIMFADGGLDFPQRKPKILDPKALTKPWYDQNQVMYADDELSWFDTKPVDDSSSRRPNIPTIPPQVYLWSVNDELAVLGDLLNDN